MVTKGDVSVQVFVNCGLCSLKDMLYSPNFHKISSGYMVISWAMYVSNLNALLFHISTPWRCIFSPFSPYTLDIPIHYGTSIPPTMHSQKSSITLIQIILRHLHVSYTFYHILPWHWLQTIKSSEVTFFHLFNKLC